MDSVTTTTTTAKDLRSALRSNDPYRLASSTFTLFLAAVTANVNNNSYNLKSCNHRNITDANGTDWSAIVNSFLEANDASKAGDVMCNPILHHLSLRASHSKFNHIIFSSTPGNTLVPLLHTICQNTYQIAATLTDDQNAMQTGRNNRAHGYKVLWRFFAGVLLQDIEWSERVRDGWMHRCHKVG